MPSWKDESGVTGSSGRSALSTSKHYPLQKSSIYSSYYDPPVRKVHHLSSASSAAGGVAGTTRVTNTASWRIGRSIAEEVLRKSRERETEKRKEEDVANGRLPSDQSPPTGNSHSSSVRPEIKISPPSNPPGARASIASGRVTESALDSDRQPPDDQEETQTTLSSSSSSTLGARADKLSSDMKQLMNELSTATPTHQVGRSSGRTDAATGSGTGGTEGDGGGGLGERGLSYSRPWRANMRDRPATARSNGSVPSK